MAWPSGFKYREYYLYSNKAYEMAPSGVNFCLLEHAVQQNAPIVVTSSGYETTYATDAWAQLEGSGKYNKKGYGHFTVTAAGSIVSDVNEFALHPDSSGRLVFNDTLNENVFIEYESGPSGYYVLDSVDFNPVRGEADSGFLHFSSVTDPNSLFLFTTQSLLRADDKHSAKLTATLYDSDYDRISNKDIIFELENVGYYIDDYSELGYLVPTKGSTYKVDASGLIVEIKETTDNKGEAHVSFLGNKGKTGLQSIKAYYLDSSGIYDKVEVALFYWQEGPFTLDISLLDSLDYLS